MQNLSSVQVALFEGPLPYMRLCDLDTTNMKQGRRRATRATGAQHKATKWYYSAVVQRGALWQWGTLPQHLVLMSKPF